MLAPHVDYVKLSRSGTGNTAEIFRGGEIYFSFCGGENFWQPASRTRNFFKAFMQTMGETATKL